jgi:hypothetical protein
MNIINLYAMEKPTASPEKKDVTTTDDAEDPALSPNQEDTTALDPSEEESQPPKRKRNKFSE